MRPGGINYEVLATLNLLRRSVITQGNEEVVVYRDKRYTYGEFLRRVFRLADALIDAGIGNDDNVVFISPNNPPLLEAHFAVPLIGAVLVKIYTHRPPEEIVHVVNHSDPKALFVYNEVAALVRPYLGDFPNLRIIVNICETSEERPLGGPEYEELLANHRTRMF